VLSLITALILAMSLVLVGCNGNNGGNGNNSDNGDAPVKTITAGVLTVGSDCDYPPFIELDGDQPAGYEFELLNAIGDEIGLTVEYLAPQNFDTILASVASGTKMDVGVSSFTINDERKQLVNFTTPYFDSNQAVVAMKTAPYTKAMDFNGLTVGAQSGTTGADWVRENLTNAGTVLKEYNQASELMAALNAGDIQGAFFDEPVAAEYVAKLYTDSQIVESIPTGEQYGISVSKDNPELLDAINKAMVTIKKNGTFDKIFLKYFPELTPPSLGA
jgi:polar amino acid transport system substrate-binding protein